MNLNEETRKLLRGYVERIEGNEAEKVRAGELIKEDFASAAANGFDKKALRALLKRRKADMEKTVKLRATVDLYMRALASFEDTELGAWAKAWEAEQRTMAASAEPRATSQDYAAASGRRERTDLN